MKTYTPRPRDIERRWYLIDAGGVILGRLATEVAAILRGKHKPIFAPHMDTGDHVVVVNASGVRLTGGKEDKKLARRHSGYPGGLTETSYSRLLATRPTFAVEKAVRGMLPKNSLGRAMIGKLKVYAGPEHPHRAQSPEPLLLGQVPSWSGLPKPQPVATTGPQPKVPAKRSAAKPAHAAPGAKRSAAKRSQAKRTTAKATAKVAAAKTQGVKRTTAEAATTKRTTGSASSGVKSPARKSPAKKSPVRRKKKGE
jgi:large subunit ribosomal protein L13